MEIKKKRQVEDEEGFKMFICYMEVRFPMIVMAKDTDAANHVALEWASEEHGNLPFSDQFENSYTKMITDRGMVPLEWRKSNPYYQDEHSGEEKTVSRIVDDWEKRTK